MIFSIQRDNEMNTSSVIALVKKLALALQVAHDKSVVHRDLKPANVMIDAEGEPVLMDFGLALQGDQRYMKCACHATRSHQLARLPICHRNKLMEVLPKLVLPVTCLASA